MLDRKTGYKNVEIVKDEAGGRSRNKRKKKRKEAEKWPSWEKLDHGVKAWPE